MGELTLEHGIVNALVYLDLIPSKLSSKEVRTPEEWTAKFDEFMDRQFEVTLGRLIRSLRQHSSITDEVEAILSSALRKRNWLAHGYFRDRAEAFLTTEGRDMMLVELQEAQKLFEKADELLNSVMKPTRVRYGFTDDRLAAACAEYLKKNNSEVGRSPDDA